MTEHDRVVDTQIERDAALEQELELTRRIELSALGVTRAVELHLAEVALSGASEETLPDEGAEIAFSLLRTSQRLIEAAKRVADQTGNEIEDINRLQQSFSPARDVPTLPAETASDAAETAHEEHETIDSDSQTKNKSTEATPDFVYNASIEKFDEDPDMVVLVIDGNRQVISTRLAELFKFLSTSDAPLARKDCYTLGYYRSAPSESARDNAFFHDRTKITLIIEEMFGEDNEVFQAYGRGPGSRYMIKGLELTDNQTGDDAHLRSNGKAHRNDAPVKKNG